MNHSPNTEQREPLFPLIDALEQLYQMTSRYAISDTDYGIVCNAAAVLEAARATQAAPASPEPRKLADKIRSLDPAEFIAPASPNTAHSQRVMAETADTISEVEAGLSELDKQFQFRSSPNTGAVPIAWALLSIMDPEVTNDPVLADYWKRKGRKVTDLCDNAALDAAKSQLAFLEGHCEQMQKEYASILGYNNKLLVELAAYRGQQIITPASPSPSKGGEADSAAEDNTGKEA